MAAVANSMIKADYDREADVLYITAGSRRPGFGDEGPGGIVLRYAEDDSSPIGATIIGYTQCHWAKVKAAKIVANHLKVRTELVLNALAEIGLR